MKLYENENVVLFVNGDYDKAPYKVCIRDEEPCLKNAWIIHEENTAYEALERMAKAGMLDEHEEGLLLDVVTTACLLENQMYHMEHGDDIPDFKIGICGRSLMPMVWSPATYDIIHMACVSTFLDILGEY